MTRAPLTKKNAPLLAFPRTEILALTTRARYVGFAAKAHCSKATVADSSVPPSAAYACPNQLDLHSKQRNKTNLCTKESFGQHQQLFSFTRRNPCASDEDGNSYSCWSFVSKPKTFVLNKRRTGTHQQPQPTACHHPLLCTIKTSDHG